MTLMATLALLLAIACGVAGWLAFGDDMIVNLVSGLLELFLGIAVAVFIINRVEKRHARREWATAYSAINGLLAATFVDVVRLLSARVANYYTEDEHRYEEFVQVAIFHSLALRSAIEGYGRALEPGSHQLFRAVELRLAWLVQKLSDRQWFCPSEEYLQRASEIAEDIGELLSRQGNVRYASARLASHSIARSLVTAGSDAPFTEAVSNRYPGQNQLLQDLRIESSSGRYIFDDIDNELAIAYFALDRELLSMAAKLLDK